MTTLSLLWQFVRRIVAFCLELLRMAGVFLLACLKLIFILGASGAISGALITTFVYLYYYQELPRDLSSVSDYQPQSLTQVFSEDGELIGEFYLERRIVVPLRKMSPTLVNAFLAAEDARFFQHRGIDPAGIFRAMISNLQAGRIVQGGSTITQQVVKNLLLSSERSFERKLKEAILSFRIEKELTKRQILDIYLNMVYLGHGAYGVEAAARAYFGRSAKELTLAEAAMLAGLVKAPTAFSPYLNFDRAKERQRYVLDRMVKNGFVSRNEARMALEEPINVLSRQNVNVKGAPYFVEYVRRLVMARYGGNLLYRKGLRIDTTLRMDWQREARKALRKGIDDMTAREGYHGPDGEVHPSLMDSFREKNWKDVLDMRLLEGKRLPPEPIVDEVYQGVVLSNSGEEIMVGVGPFEVRLEPSDLAIKAPRYENDTWIRSAVGDVLKRGSIVRVKYLADATRKNPARCTLKGVPAAQGALISVEPRSGYVRAMVGGYDFRQSRYNRAVQSRRQPGSSFKPFVYATALENGLDQMTLFNDVPTTYRVAGGALWSPRNYGNRFYGKVTMRTALTKSLNSISVKLLSRYGVDNVIRTARRLGIKSPLATNLSLALGSSDLTLIELTSAYAGLAGLGQAVEPVFIERITDSEGRVIEERGQSAGSSRWAVRGPEDGEAGLMLADIGQDRGPDRSLDPAPDDLTTEDELDPALGSRQAIRPATAYILVDMMKNVVQHGTGRRVKAIGRPAAGKTGTTNGYIDAWFVGFTPDLATGVWLGTDTRNPLGPHETGGTAAAPIWLDYMSKALEDLPPRDFEVPPGVVFAQANPITGEATKRTHAPYLPFRLDNVPERFLPRDATVDPADVL